MRLFRRGAFVAAVAMTVLLSLYFVLVTQIAVAFLMADAWVGKVLGVALFVLPVIGVWYVVVEWRLGTAVQRMADTLEGEGALPMHDGEREPSGRLTEAAAEAVFEVARRDAEEHPDDWRAWFRVAWAYDENRDRSMARKSLRHAADLFRAERRTLA